MTGRQIEIIATKALELKELEHLQAYYSNIWCDTQFERDFANKRFSEVSARIKEIENWINSKRNK